MTKKILLEIPETLLEKFDKTIKEKGEYISRSEAIRMLMKKYANDIKID